MQGFPGFDPLTGVLSGDETRNITIDIGNGQTIQADHRCCLDVSALLADALDAARAHSVANRLSTSGARGSATLS